MALPQRIQQQLDQADQVLAQMNGQPQQVEQQEPPEAPQVEVAPALEAPAAAPVAPSPAPAPAADQYTDLLGKYQVLQGMHRSYLKKIDTLESQVADLSKPRQEAPKPDVTTDQKDVEAFGQDLVDMVKRVAETMFGSAARQFDGRIAAIEQRLDGTTNVVSRTADEVFIDRLTAMVPDYESINTSDGFLAWLGEVDEVYGVPRQDALTAAGAARDVSRVAKVFLAYKKTLQPVVAHPVEVPPAPAPKVSQLERQVAPRASARAAPAPANSAQIITQAQVQGFYRDVQRGVYRGREAEADQIEAMLNQALAEGRIQ